MDIRTHIQTYIHTYDSYICGDDLYEQKSYKIISYEHKTNVSEAAIVWSFVARFKTCSYCEICLNSHKLKYTTQHNNTARYSIS